MKTALLLIDIQNDYFPGGKMPLEGVISACFSAKELLAVFRERGLPVIHVKHLSTREGAKYFLPGTEGVEIHPIVQPHSRETLIAKHFPNCFRDTGLLSHLRELQVEHLVITGMMTHMCIDATVRAAFDLGFSCTVIGDACATKDLEFKDVEVPAEFVQAAFLSALQGTYADVRDLRDFITDFDAVTA